MSIALILALLLLAYLLGSLSGSLLIGRARGIDIRAEGSGNAGATNALRTHGWRFALATLVIDVGKGVLAASLLPWMGGLAGVQVAPLVLGLACVLAAAIGHCYPVWFGFRGGKAAGTLFGGLLWLLPAITGATFAVWLVVLLLTGYVGLATVCAGLALPLLYALWGGTGAALAICIAAGLLIVYMHRGNLQRLAQGSEHCFRKIRLLPGPAPRQGG